MQEHDDTDRSDKERSLSRQSAYLEMRSQPGLGGKPVGVYMMPQFGSAWIKVTCPRPEARLRLICLPCAGGGASSYRLWPASLPDHMEVLSIQLPGREDRFCEPAIDDIWLLTCQLVDALAGWLDRPFALFGHSMGAFVAFELARSLCEMGLEPVRFFASGCRAPHLPANCPDRHLLPDRDFIAAVRELNGIPRALAENAELMELALPALRSDFKLVETYRYLSGAPLRCPISVLGGLEDNTVTRDGLAAWSQRTIGPVDIHLLPGDHFFVNFSRAALLELISLRLGGWATVA